MLGAPQQVVGSARKTSRAMVLWLECSDEANGAAYPRTITGSQWQSRALIVSHPRQANP